MWQRVREIADCVSAVDSWLLQMMRAISDYVTDSEGDCWLIQTMREIVNIDANHEGHGWLCQNDGGCWLLQWVRLLTVSQTMRETECVTHHEGCWLCHRKGGRLLTVAQTVREIAECYRLLERLLTVAQVMREIADCGTDHEGDDWLTQIEGDCWLCHRPWGRMLTVAQVMREIVDCVTDHEGNCCMYHSWPWIQYITCALWFWHCIISILYFLSLPWITNGFEPSSVQNLIKQCCLTLLLTPVNTILQYDETVKCMLEKRHVKWLYRNDTVIVGYDENSRSNLSHLYKLILSKPDSKLTVHI